MIQLGRPRSKTWNRGGGASVFHDGSANGLIDNVWMLPRVGCSFGSCDRLDRGEEELGHVMRPSLILDV